MAPIIPADLAINWGSVAVKVIYWLGYIVAAIVMLALVYVAYIFTTFKIKIDEYHLRGSGQQGQFAIGKKLTNRARWVNNRTGWKSLYPLFNSKERQPFPPQYIYPGNRAVAYVVDGEWWPVSLNVINQDNVFGGEINPVPYHIRQWEALQHKKNAIEFAKQDWWSENRTIVMALIAVGICCALGAFTVWITYKFAAPSAGQMEALTTAISSLNTIPSKY